jgi:hypothetical protein
MARRRVIRMERRAKKDGEKRDDMDKEEQCCESESGFSGIPGSRYGSGRQKWPQEIEKS